MSLSPGERLGPYEVLGPIGAGGMGEVYRARDTRLDRTVALKVLPAELAADPSLKARFEREARAISALAHPNICTLHDVGEQDGRTFLVMEYLVGETLAERLKKGPLPLEQALEIATQIGDALSAAHKQGIVHRDLKPANVMLTKTGARLLDFGLARLTAHGARPAVEAFTSAPTEPEPLTARGTIMGTLPYMAPEQVEGKPADVRTDLWALGAILYEMLTGERPFQASNPTSLVGAILEREPAPLKERQPLTPPSLERLVQRSLAKDPDDRWDTAHDVADELRWVAEASTATDPRATKGLTAPARWGLGAAALVAAGALGAISVWALRPSPKPPAVIRALLDVRPADEVSAGSIDVTATAGGSLTSMDWTPDGQKLVFVGRRDGVQQLWVRDLEGGEARPLPETEGASGLAVSRDGQRVAFWADEAIQTVPLAGGPATRLTSVSTRPVGVVWGADGQIFYGQHHGAVVRVSPDGVTSEATERLETEPSHFLPVLLPDGNALLFTPRRRLWTWGDEEVVLQDLTTGERTVLLRDAVDARYVSSGHLVFLRKGVLFAVPFDARRRVLEGPPVALLKGVSQALNGEHGDDFTGAGQFAVSATGTLAYIAGELPPFPDRTLVAVDRRGRVSPLPSPPRSFFGGVRVSPDGGRLAVSARSLTEQALWVADIVRGTLTRLTHDDEVGAWPLWSPAGERIAFSQRRNGVRTLAWQQADGAGPSEVLLARRAGALSSWSPDGRTIATVIGGDIWIVTPDGSRAPEPLAETPFFEGWPEFSPDGRWLAFASDESGRHEVYVQPWPGPGPRQQVSLEGGLSPAWNPGGRELFFLSPPEWQPQMMALMALDVDTEPTLRLSTPRKLFEWSPRELLIHCTPARCYDVDIDGQRFFTMQFKDRPEPPSVTHIHLVQNWLEEVKARVPTGR